MTIGGETNGRRDRKGLRDMREAVPGVQESPVLREDVRKGRGKKEKRVGT